MSAQFSALRALVFKILQRPNLYSWSLQGFGMLRLHLPDDIRLNVWDSGYRVPNVSLVHTHPWDFESVIVSGRLHNTRYQSFHPSTGIGAPWNHASIKPGPGGGIVGATRLVHLMEQTREIYNAGDTYRQRAEEIHMSLPEDGTVTINERKRVGEDVALVYWPVGESWVSAEPRPASMEEVARICGKATAVWTSL